MQLMSVCLGSVWIFTPRLPCRVLTHHAVRWLYTTGVSWRHCLTLTSSEPEAGFSHSELSGPPAFSHWGVSQNTDFLGLTPDLTNQKVQNLGIFVFTTLPRRFWTTHKYENHWSKVLNWRKTSESPSKLLKMQRLMCCGIVYPVSPTINSIKNAETKRKMSLASTFC